MRVSDTTDAAAAVCIELYRKMSPAQRCALAAQMSQVAREIVLAGIRQRHREYDEGQAQWALFRLLVGDVLFRRVWPSAPVLDP